MNKRVNRVRSSRGVRSLPRLFDPVHRAFLSLRPVWQRFIINCFIGAAVEFIAIPVMQTAFPGPMSALENLGFDQITSLHALLQPASPYLKDPPHQLFVKVDDATWRSPDWGGGEPERAPRQALLTLIDKAFTYGASQVVLDVLVEGKSAENTQEDEEDRQFARKLEALLSSDKIAKGAQLVLVRSLRRPLPQLVIRNDNTLRSEPYPALSELRESSSMDRIIDDSKHAPWKGHVAVAAPYFVYSPDRVLREWELLEVTCQRGPDGTSGKIRVTPSVQLLVAAHYLGVPPESMENSSHETCRPFPLQPLDSPVAAPALAAQRERVEEDERNISSEYWSRVTQAVRQATAGKRDLGTPSFKEEDLANRVVFRSSADLQADKYFSEVPARLLLDGSIDSSRLKQMFDGRIVIIGQTYAEAGDQHYTPAGQMAGSIVLLNAIDSMLRYPLIQPLNEKVKLLISLFLIAVVGYIFACWDSAIGPLICVAIALPLLSIASYYFFTYGIWFDLALPILAILAHREFKSYEERRELRKLQKETGGGHSH